MEVPLEVRFRNMAPSPALEAAIRERAQKLEEFCDRITGCRVVVEAPHRRHHQGNLYHLRIDLTVPGREIVVRRDPPEDRTHEDVYVVVRDAFDAVRRQLEDHVRRQRGDVKSHTGPPHGRIVRLLPEKGYGFIRAADGREIYFHAHAVVGETIDRLAVGAEVAFVEELGEKGPQASTVRLVR
ncbi:MAG TPA: HPF/RaiA family ribosome-associated protein [Candidatus Binatia bacterium]|nr:HPF/RaiA family ribosome-associated protein [Candidatus Binatia bacterium]